MIFKSYSRLVDLMDVEKMSVDEMANDQKLCFQLKAFRINLISCHSHQTFYISVVAKT